MPGPRQRDSLCPKPPPTGPDRPANRPRPQGPRPRTVGPRRQRRPRALAPPPAPRRRPRSRENFCRSLRIGHAARHGQTTRINDSDKPLTGPGLARPTGSHPRAAHGACRSVACLCPPPPAGAPVPATHPPARAGRLRIVTATGRWAGRAARRTRHPEPAGPAAGPGIAGRRWGDEGMVGGDAGRDV